MFKSYIYIYVMVHSTCKCYPLFVPLTCNSNMFYYYITILFTISSCAMSLWCVTYHHMIIHWQFNAINHTGHLLLNFFLEIFFILHSACYYMEHIHFFKNYFFLCDSPVQLTSVLLCHHNILPVSKYFTYFYLKKKYFIIDL